MLEMWTLLSTLPLGWFTLISFLTRILREMPCKWTLKTLRVLIVTLIVALWSTLHTELTFSFLYLRETESPLQTAWSVVALLCLGPFTYFHSMCQWRLEELPSRTTKEKLRQQIFTFGGVIYASWILSPSLALLSLLPLTVSTYSFGTRRPTTT